MSEKDSLYFFSQNKYPARPSTSKPHKTAEITNNNNIKIGATICSFTLRKFGVIKLKKIEIKQM